MLQAFLNWIVPFLFGGIVTGTTVFFKKLNKREKAERNGIPFFLAIKRNRKGLEGGAKSASNRTTAAAVGDKYTEEKSPEAESSGEIKIK